MTIGNVQLQMGEWAMSDGQLPNAKGEWAGQWAMIIGHVNLHWVTDNGKWAMTKG